MVFSLRTGRSRTSLQRYDDMSRRAAEQVIASYSTSFYAASGLLAPSIRSDIRSLYAAVRIADEIVDGAADEAREDAAAALDTYQNAVLNAPRQRFHTDPVLHAYGIAARHCQFKDEHMEAFFDSMRRDLGQKTYNDGDLDDYVYGSAEVIGLMCLCAFVADSDIDPAPLEPGACALGSAFQKINFLRDYGSDHGELGRTYFPGTDTGLTDASKQRIIADIRNELAEAKKTMSQLPLTARIGVIAACDLFEEVTDRLEASPAVRIADERVSVPAPRKAALLARSIVRAGEMSWRNR